MSSRGEGRDRKEKDVGREAGEREPISDGTKSNVLLKKCLMQNCDRTFCEKIKGGKAGQGHVVSTLNFLGRFI